MFAHSRSHTWFVTKLTLKTWCFRKLAMKIPNNLHFDKIRYSFGKNNNKNSLKTILKNFPNAFALLGINYGQQIIHFRIPLKNILMKTLIKSRLVNNTAYKHIKFFKDRSQKLFNKSLTYFIGYRSITIKGRRKKSLICQLEFSSAFQF